MSSFTSCTIVNRLQWSARILLCIHNQHGRKSRIINVPRDAGGRIRRHVSGDTRRVFIKLGRFCEPQPRASRSARARRRANYRQLEYSGDLEMRQKLLWAWSKRSWYWRRRLLQLKAPSKTEVFDTLFSNTSVFGGAFINILYDLPLQNIQPSH